LTAVVIARVGPGYPSSSQARHGIGILKEGVFHLETAAKQLISLGRVSGLFSKCALKSLDNQAGFDSAIPWFESRRPSQCQSAEFFTETVLFLRGYLAHLEKWIPL
jgi:hypothetical protein